MCETALIITLDNDDEPISLKDSESCTSPNSSKTKRSRLTFPFGACRVCSDSATGIHYGIATCEGCKGFFKRSILRKEKYRCYFDNTCLINVTNRNRCKACRFRRCIDEGMSIDGVKMGRIPKLVKERALKEQQMKQEAALAKTTEVHRRETSCSSLSDRSIENDDPNAMETDYNESQVSPVQRHGGLTTTYINENKLSHNLPVHNDQMPVLNDIYQSTNESNFSENNNNENSINITSETLSNIESSAYRTKYPTFLPDDFTTDETEGLTEQSTGSLTIEVLKHVRSISNKLITNKSSLVIDLTEDESTFIRFLRWSAYNTCLRHSKRVKQLITRMNQMIEHNIREYPGDNSTLEEFLVGIRLSCEVYTRATVVYVQEIPGIKNLDLNDLKKILVQRTFGLFVIKYHELYNNNGECYLLSPNDFQLTRYWMNEFFGGEYTDALFHFCRRFRELHLSESEYSLVVALHIFYYDSTMEDQETPRMLRSCYLYALYVELCHNRGEIDGKLTCSKILQVLDLLIPLNKLYEKDVAAKILEA